MFPVDLVNEEKKSGELTDIIPGNLYEMMNILSSQFMDETISHLRLSELKKADDMDGVDSGPNTATFNVDMKGYGQVGWDSVSWISSCERLSHTPVIQIRALRLIMGRPDLQCVVFYAASF